MYNGGTKDVVSLLIDYFLNQTVP